MEICDLVIRIRQMVRPVHIFPVYPYCMKTCRYRPGDVILGMVSDINNVSGRSIKPLCQVLVDQAIRLGYHQICRVNRMLDQMIQPDMFDTGIAVGDCTDSVSLFQSFQAG